MRRVRNLIRNNFTFIKYLLNAGASFIIDITLFSLFIILFKGKISSFEMAATICARIFSSTFNYLVNRNKVFKNSEGKIDRVTFIKYTVQVIIQTIISGLMVTYFYNNLSLPSKVLSIPAETIIKIPVECFLFISNYFILKYYIFTKEPISLRIPYNIRTLLFGIFCTFSLLIKLDRNSIIHVTKTNTNVMSTCFLAILLMVFYKKFHKKCKRNIFFNVLAVLFSIFMTVGYSYDVVGSAYLVFGNPAFIIISIIKLVSFYSLFRVCINITYNFITSYKIREFVKENKFIKTFNKHPFLFSFIMIIVCYIPYIFAFYPAVMGYDPSNQIREFMGMHTRYMDSVILLDPKMTITNFNPVLHTLFLGGCFKLGHMMGNDNLGLFIYVVLQTIFMASVLAYSISYMKKRGVANKLLLIVLFAYSFIPVFPFYAITTNKDTIFCCFVLLYCLKLYDLIKYEQSTKNYITMFLIMLMVTLTRNNGVYTLVLSMPFTLIWLKNKRKQILVILSSVLVCYIGYNKVLLPAFKISNTSIREMLSVPFQQTARLAKYHPESFSEHDKKVIDNILIFDTLGERYNPKLSDPVKNKFNIYTTNKDLVEYFKVWNKGLYKHPDVYMDATINNVYGYFYPNTSSWYIYYEYNTKLKEAGFDYHYNGLSDMRNVLSEYGLKYPYIPLLGLFVNIAFVGWIYFFLFAALLTKKEYRLIPFVLPAISFILVCVAGPANTYFRYALPYIMPLPMTLCLLYYDFQHKEEVKLVSNNKKKSN